MSLTTKPESKEHKDLCEFLLQRPWVKFLQLQWIDFSGALRARGVTKEYALELTASGKFLQSSPMAFQCIADNTLLPDVDLTTSNLYQPDWNSIRNTGPGTLASSYATVMCDVSQVSFRTPEPSTGCPRLALSRVLHTAAENFDLSFLVGFEVELMIMQCSSTGDYVPYSSSFGRYSAAGLRDPAYQLVEKCLDELQAAGVSIQGFHSEGYCGQYEISLGPLPPIQAVDQLVLVHDKIKNVVLSHGYQATFSPKPNPEWHGNGQHTHISISPPVHEEYFLAGILKSLRGICAITLPYEASYQRIKRTESGTTVAWGSENRAVPVRRVAAGHWEIRCVDALANMYLALAVILSAGILGIQKKEVLCWEDETFVSEGSRKSHETTQSLPQSLFEALGSLDEGFDPISSLVGDGLLERYMRHKKHENSVLGALRPEDVRQLLIQHF
ncbi:glutamine synthetase/guanido kinase [Penicillium lividum]|nr:glutamine synthetase/guanido kinase [Penicillium lividum]